MDLGEDVNTPTTRLLTLLNVSALKSRKRIREDSPAPEKLNKRKTVKIAEDIDLDSGPLILHDKTNNGVEDDAIGRNEANDGVDLQGMAFVSTIQGSVLQCILRQIPLHYTNSTMDQTPILYQMYQETLWTKDAGSLRGRKLVNYQRCLLYEMKIPPLHRKNWPKRQQYVQSLAHHILLMS